MTPSEIRALLADCEEEYHLLGRNTGLNVPKLRTAIETLLAREAEVSVKLKRIYTFSCDDNVNVALLDVIRISENEHD